MRGEIPQTRKPIEDENPLTNRDTLKKFLLSDSRWKSLPDFFKFLVVTNVQDIANLDAEGIKRRAQELDHEAKSHPYLKTMTEKEGDLMELHSTFTGIFHKELNYDNRIAEGASDRLVKIFIAGRQLGKSMADHFGWDQKDGFGQYARHAHIALDLCTKAIHTVPSQEL